MKLKSKILLVVVGGSLLLTGCGNSNTEAVSKSSIQETNKVKVEEKMDSSTVDTNEETNKKEKIRKGADVYGRVKSIIGNEVVLELAEMPQRKAGENGKKISGEKPINPSGEEGNGQGGHGMGKKIKLIGETETLLIPVGIDLTTFSRDGEKEIDIADIYEGAMMKIWYDENDQESKTITKVMMIQGRQ
ncbi:hypothetical protein [Crassaminicella profunda]|uniref:hypothetical protein n=1 Tax=Crassaminicella profunda TaxID=1286698 RepID=UPI001CA67D61|nr:hypothetical protein [Crassaminicella profunda]QZY54896.1 hypothetical protein K7H06_18035 [Crassaminicella profunda]